MTAVLIIFAVLIGLVGLYIIIGIRHRIVLQNYSFKSSKVKSKIKIAFLSDLHSSLFGAGNCQLFALLEKEAPHILLFGGDMIHNEKKLDRAVEFLTCASKKYSVYAVMGNHEQYIVDKGIMDVRQLYREWGIKLLENENITLSVNSSSLNLCGVDMPAENGPLEDEYINKALSGIDTDNYTLLLFHRPEVCERFDAKGVDLVLSGHAHGGQWILPGLINGVYCPGQGLFPKYAGGYYKLKGGTDLVVSRGLAKINSTIVPRVFNPPELVIIDIEPK